MDKIEKDDEFYDRHSYERINAIVLGKTLNQPPQCFSEQAKAAWKADVDLYLVTLSGSFAFTVDDYEGSYDVVLDYEYDREEKESYIVLKLSSLSEEGEARSFRINARRLKRSAERDRETTVAAYDAKGKFNSESVIRNIDNLKRGYHAMAAKILLDEIKNADIDCRNLDFCKNFFALLRVILPMDKSMNLELARVYGRQP